MRIYDKNRHFMPLAFTVAMAGTLFSASTFGAVVNSPALDFNINAPTSGTISFAGSTSDTLIGTDIQVNSVVGLGTASNDGVTLNCINCYLNFETGAYTGAAGNLWMFNGGGFITLFGSLDTNGDGNADIINAMLLSGRFNQASNVSYDLGQLVFNIAAGTFADTKNPDLLAYYGLPDVGYLGGMAISFTTAAGASQNVGDAFTSTQVLSGDILNTPVPLPAAAWLLGSGLLVMAGVNRRRRG
jgi:hypothetical protein